MIDILIIEKKKKRFQRAGGELFLLSSHLLWLASSMVKGWTALATLGRTSLRCTIRYRAGCIAGAADVCRSDHVLAVFLVVPGISFDALLSDAKLLGFQLNHLQVKGQLDTTPIVTNTNSKRESFTFIQQVLSAHYIHQLLDDLVRIRHISDGDVTSVFSLAWCVYDVQALSWCEYCLHLVQTALNTTEDRCSLAWRVHSV